MTAVGPTFGMSPRLAQTQEFRRDGYCVLRGALQPDECGHLKDVFGRLSDLPGRVVTRFGRRLVVTRNLWQVDRRAAELTRALGTLAGRLMGTSQVRLIDDIVLIKPPRAEGGDPTIWHQDAPNFPFDRRGFLTIWVAVDDIGLEQGPLTFLPGSHRLGLLGAVDGGGEEVTLHSLLREDDLNHVGEPVAFELSAGDATVHDGGTLHAAGANLTDRPRRAWGVRFIPASTLYTGGAHRSFDGLGLAPFEPFEHDQFPLIDVHPGV